jgi:hypothetical protein
MLIDVYLCPVPTDANPADVRLRVPAGGCGGGQPWYVVIFEGD